MIAHRLAVRQGNAAMTQLQKARNALGGVDAQGQRVSPTMFDPDVISFSHGEGMQRPSPLAIGAAIRGLLDTDKSTLDNYFFLQNYRPLMEKIRDDFMAMGIDAQTASTICEDAGATKLYCGYLYAVSNPGDIFLTAPTHYHPVTNLCDIFRTEIQVVPTARSRDYKLTAEDIEAWAAAHGDLVAEGRVKGIILFNPTMTGAVYTEDENRALAAAAQRHDLLILSDAIFAGTEFDGKSAHQIASLPEAADRTVTVNGASKTMALANMRYGWACGPSEIINRMRSHAVATGLTIPQAVKLMVDAAFADRDQYLAENRDECIRRVELIRAEVDRINVSVARALGLPGLKLMAFGHEPVASHSLLLHMDGLAGCRTPAGDTIRDSADLVRFMLQEAKVSASPGVGFGFDDCTVRLAYACVGAQLTYAQSRPDELSAAFRAVASAQQGAPNIDVPAEAIPNVAEGYEAGRALIAEAFARLEPALKNLALANAPLIRLRWQAGQPQGPGQQVQAPAPGC